MAVLVAMVSAIVVGALWYSKALFANAWVSLIGKNMDEMKKGAGAGYAAAILGSLVEALTLSWFVHQLYASVTIMNSLHTALLLAVGIVLPVMLVAYMFERRPMKLFAIN